MLLSVYNYKGRAGWSAHFRGMLKVYASVRSWTKLTDNGRSVATPSYQGSNSRSHGQAATALRKWGSQESLTAGGFCTSKSESAKVASCCCLAPHDCGTPNGRSTLSRRPGEPLARPNARAWPAALALRTARPAPARTYHRARTASNSNAPARARRAVSVRWYDRYILAARPWRAAPYNESFVRNEVVERRQA